MTKEEALDRLLTAKNYREICPDTVRREFELQLARRGDPAAAEKAARERLHAVTGAFLTAGELKQARKCLKDYAAGDKEALSAALRLHASTRERMKPGLEGMDELFGRVFAATGRDVSVFDAACGLDPLYLGARGLKVFGADIHGGCTDLINDWAGACGWQVSARCMDLSISVPDEEYGLLLAMKLLPVLETAEKGGALKFLDRVKARYFCVTFPTRTLGGRDLGMEQNYARFFETEIDGRYAVRDKFVCGSELIYLLTR